MMFKIKEYDDNSLAIICENMLTLYETGISFVLIFDLINDLPIKKSYKNSMILISKKIKNGASLEAAFSDYKHLYPDLFVGMIGIGEKNGNLSKVLASLKKYYFKMVYIKMSIKNALIYPVIIFIALILLLIFMTLYILPNLYSFYESLDHDIPHLFMISKYIKDIILLKPFLALTFLISYVLIPVCLYYLFKNKIKVTFIYKLKIIKLFYEFLYISIINIIISSGINVISGLEQAITSFESNYIKEKLINLKTNILEGKSISESLRLSKECSDYTVSIIKIGEESGSIELKLESVMNYLEGNIVKIVNKLIAIVQPISILFLGGMVIVFIINYILPIFDVMYSV